MSTTRTTQPTPAAATNTPPAATKLYSQKDITLAVQALAGISAVQAHNVVVCAMLNNTIYRGSKLTYAVWESAIGPVLAKAVR